jgi:phosphoribosylaminoimidazole (AIR) synthetase
MAEIINDEYMVCADCIVVIATGDYTALDYCYQADESEKRMKEINSGLSQAGGYVLGGESDRDEEFSRRPCDCCGSSLHGARTHCVVLGANKK